MPESSAIRNVHDSGLVTILGSTHCCTAPSTASSDQGESATKWCSDWCIAGTWYGSMAAANGSMLLRLSGSISALQ